MKSEKSRYALPNFEWEYSSLEGNAFKVECYVLELSILFQQMDRSTAVKVYLSPSHAQFDSKVI